MAWPATLSNTAIGHRLLLRVVLWVYTGPSCLLFGVSCAKGLLLSCCKSGVHVLGEGTSAAGSRATQSDYQLPNLGSHKVAKIPIMINDPADSYQYDYDCLHAY